jgi:hypothetical protein
MPEAPSASEAVSTPATETSQVSTATESTQDVNLTTSPSSGDEGAKAPTSVFDAVNAALKPKSDAPESSPASETPEKTDPAAAEVPLSDDPSPDELNRLHSQTRKRVKQLLGQRNDARNEIAQLKPRAEQADRINRFVEASGLDWSEVNSGFELMRLMKNDPLEARKQLEPIWNALNKICGHELPPDLQQKVSQGFIDEPTAQELAQQRARAHLATSQNQRTVQTVQQQRERAAAQQFGASVQSAIKTFENSWKGSDPDYAVKSPRVMEKVELALSRMAAKGETLKSPADAVKLVEDAKKAVEAELKPFVRRREQIDPLPGGGVTANGSPKPKSMAEAVAAGLRA